MTSRLLAIYLVFEQAAIARYGFEDARRLVASKNRIGCLAATRVVMECAFRLWFTATAPNGSFRRVLSSDLARSAKPKTFDLLSDGEHQHLEKLRNDLGASDRIEGSIERVAEEASLKDFYSQEYAALSEIIHGSAAARYLAVEQDDRSGSRRIRLAPHDDPLEEEAQALQYGLLIFSWALAIIGYARFQGDRDGLSDQAQRIASTTWPKGEKRLEDAVSSAQWL